MHYTGEYPIIAGRINDIAWDGDSQRIIAVGDGKERFGHCITADSGNSVGEISGQSSQINSVSIRQQRPLRAATGSDDTSVAFYHGAPFKFNTSLRGQHNKFVYGTAFSPDGSLLVSVGSDRKIWLYDGKTGEVQKQIGEGEHTGSIFAVSWSKDSKHFVTGSADQTVRIWEAESGKCTESWRLGGDSVHIPSQQVGVVWPHGRSDGLIISLDLGGNLNYLTPGNAKPVRVVHGHQGSITAASLSASTLVTGSYEGRIRAWDVSTGTASAIDGESHSTYVAGIAASSTHMSSVGWDDSLRSIDLSAKTFTGISSKTSSQPKGVAVSKSGHSLVATANSIEMFGSDGKQLCEIAVPGASPSCIAVSHGSDTVVVGCSNNTLATHTITEGGKGLTPSRTISDPTVTSAPSTLAFSPDGSHLAVGTSQGRICVFKTSDWSLATSRWSAHAARVTSVSWNPTGEYAVSGSLDTNVHVWSLKEPGKRVKAGNAHKDGVNGVVWLDEGRVISCGADAAVRVWKIEGL